MRSLRKLDALEKSEIAASRLLVERDKLFCTSLWQLDLKWRPYFDKDRACRASGGSTLGPEGTGPPNLAQAAQMFNWFYNNFA